ncbi:MAG: Uncharacterized protein XD93_0689 [candidate division WS6 bacterium 34_10]|uniref:LamG-like jellyroll fold domain-containing protein n=1 Tax=candidate division WS6 bacterium 34_10 TaxID=1641389 RepID=A0A101HH93_9BACT|nr:MAG: Uncharacterized protein XD93_0689 [candidate division WS6 bacterium 34_10]
MRKRKSKKLTNILSIGSFFVIMPLLVLFVFRDDVNFDLRSDASSTGLCAHYAYADLDNDDSVGMGDFAIWLNKYREFKDDSSTYSRYYDLDKDGNIALGDFSLWLNRWREYKSCRLDSSNCFKGCAIEIPVCGDTICEGNETKANCPTDCIVCGDGICEGDETTASCPSDCEEDEPIDNPVTDAEYTVKVASVAYYPIDISGNLDKTVVNNNWNEYNMSLTQVKNKVDGLISGLESSLEEGSIYKGYSNPNARKSMEYVIHLEKEYEEAIPVDYNKNYYNSDSIYMTDYNDIMNRLNICDLVDNQGVKEVWIWSYTGIDRTGWESNFSSKYGDISNSDNDTSDLPICNGSYTVYEFNYGRGVNEAIHSTFHQLESIFRFLDADLFDNKFVGEVGANAEGIRRCGNCHYPPNGTEKDGWGYDYANREVYVESDFLDWKPETIGKTTNFNCELWDCDERKYYIMWRQSVPGLNNGLIYKGKSMPNWWSFIADFDGMMARMVTNPSSLPLLGYWELEDLAFRDSSGNSFHGSPKGAHRVVSVIGKKGNAAEIGLNDSRIEIDEGSKFLLNNAGSLFRSQNFTIMAYVKRPNTSCNYNYCAIFSKGSDHFQGYSMAVYNKKLSLRINDDASNAAIGSTTLNANTWYHLAATYNSSTGKLKVYVNGVLDGTATKTGPITYKDARVVIGNANFKYDLPLMGQIDEVRFFNKALSEQEIMSYL